MKGIVFTEFMPLAEEQFSPGIVDHVIESSELPNGGAYTAVGTYDHREILRMVRHLSQRAGVDATALVRAFGEYLAVRFSQMYPAFFSGIESCFDFLPLVESRIHIEVKKLYADAELPTIACRRISENLLELEYRSARPFADLAQGLISGTAKYFGEQIEIARQDLTPESGYATRFSLAKI